MGAMPPRQRVGHLALVANPPTVNESATLLHGLRGAVTALAVHARARRDLVRMLLVAGFSDPSNSGKRR
jgi:hypothetical protein